MRSLRRSAAALLAGAGLTMGLVACSDNGGDSNNEPGINEASEDTLVIYSGRGEDLISPLIDQFEEATGISTEVRYAGSAEQAQLLLTEGENSPAQVFLSQEAGALGLVGQEGLLAELPESIIAEVPAEFSADDDTWVGLTGRARVVAYDSETVDEDEVPTTAEEIVDPKWTGEIGVAPGNASFLAFVTAMRIVEGDEATEQWLENLAAIDPQTFERNGGILEAVNAGEVEIGLINHYYWYKQAAEQGEENMRARLVYGEAGDVAGLVNATGVGIMKNAEDNENALAFVEFLLSEQGQTYFVESEYEYPLVPGMPQPEGVPPFDSLRGPDIDLSDLGTIEESAALVDEAGLTVG